VLAQCCLDDREELVVYKPAAGARPLYDFDVDTLPAREAATYLVSEALGWGFVPATVVRPNGPLGSGSIQAFVNHDPAMHYFTLTESRPEEFKRLALFDLLTNNADRKSGHCLLGSDGRVWAIDNGLTFHRLPKIRTVIWDFAGMPVPAAAREAVAQFACKLGKARLRHSLEALLEEGEVDALARRATALAQARNFPPPRSDWSFPWPLV
jgi:uncharacterized repeat protein (TIGR03843 family)